MILSVRLGTSASAQQVIESFPQSEKAGKFREIDRTFQLFLTNEDFSDAAILTLCKKSSTLLHESFVSSHFIEGYMLFIFIDAVSHEHADRFIYTTHSKKVH